MGHFEKYCQRRGVRCLATETGLNDDERDGWANDPGATHWDVELRFQRRKLKTRYHMGSAHCREPEGHEVLHCLIDDARSVQYARGFEDWARGLGYEPDSRKAERIYRACEKTARDLRKFLGTELHAFYNAAGQND